MVPDGPSRTVRPVEDRLETGQGLGTLLFIFFIHLSVCESCNVFPIQKLRKKNFPNSAPSYLIFGTYYSNLFFFILLLLLFFFGRAIFLICVKIHTT